jgi:6-pyruvoyltetrahydropterin/6-carboxytetrahydropterin synthase
MYELKVQTHFAAAHQLRMVADKCENLHGHNWKIEVCVQGEKLNEAGILIDFGEIKRYVADIMKVLDHKFLNELDIFPGGNPSSESIARYIADTLQARIDDPAIAISRVTAWESDNASATYLPQTPRKDHPSA